MIGRLFNVDEELGLRVDPPEELGTEIGPEVCDTGGRKAAGEESSGESWEETLLKDEGTCQFWRIENALKKCALDDAPPDTSFYLGVGEVAALLPPEYLCDTAGDVDTEQRVLVTLDDLFEQLAQGRVIIPVAQLVRDMPDGLVSAAAFDDWSQMVLPLRVVVSAMNPAALARRTPRPPAPPDMGGMPDPFEEPVPGEPVAEPAVEPAPAPAVTRPPVRRAEEYCREPELPERLGGVNINTATADQLMTLPGATATVAASILEYRRVHGPFTDIFALRAVPRVGRVTFRRLTGMPYSRVGRHRIRRLMRLLGVPVERIHHLPTLACRVAEQPGFEGCVVSDRDGLILAQHGAEDHGHVLAAVTPRMLDQLGANMAEVQDEEVRSLTLTAGNRMYTVVCSGRVYLAAIHSRRRLTGAQLVLVQRVAEELEWMLSHRAYAGGTA